MIERLLAGEGALERGELDAAERLFTQVADADARNAIAIVGLARVAQRRADPKGARALAERALGIDPDEAAATRLLADLDRPSDASPGPVLSAGQAPAAAEVLNLGAAADADSAASAPKPQRSGWRGLLDRILRRG